MSCKYENIPLEPSILNTDAPQIRLTGVSKTFGRNTALDTINLDVFSGEALGIVGESGSGKSTLLRILNLEIQADAGQYTFEDDKGASTDLLALDEFEKRRFKSDRLGIVYQNPRLGLRMTHTSSGNVAERLVVSGERSFQALRRRTIRALESSEFPLDRIDDVPLSLSGGMQQRVQIAKAIALEPSVLLLDEPTTGLDVSVQALVLDTLRRLQKRMSATMIVVSHDLGVIKMLADRVVVMKDGQIIERGLTDQILYDPQEPYTQQLISAKL